MWGKDTSLDEEGSGRSNIGGTLKRWNSHKPPRKQKPSTTRDTKHKQRIYQLSSWEFMKFVVAKEDLNYLKNFTELGWKSVPDFITLRGEPLVDSHPREAASPMEEKQAPHYCGTRKEYCKRCQWEEQPKHDKAKCFNCQRGYKHPPFEEQPKCKICEVPNAMWRKRHNEYRCSTCNELNEHSEKPKQPILKLNIVGRDGVSFKSVEVLMEAKINEIIDALYPLTKSQ